MEFWKFQRIIRHQTNPTVFPTAELTKNSRQFHEDRVDEPIKQLCKKMQDIDLWAGEQKLVSPNGSDALSATRSLAKALKVMVCVGASVEMNKPIIDGPAGAAALVNALLRTGKIVTLVTDPLNYSIVREALYQLNPNAQYLKILVMQTSDDATSYADKALRRYTPDAVVAIGLPGRDAEGSQKDERQRDLRCINSPIDEIINQANANETDTIAVASHHSHCGMAGTEKPGTVGLTVIPASHVVISPTANLGAQLLGEILLRLADKSGNACTPDQYLDIIKGLFKLGAVDGLERRSPNEQSINVRMANAITPDSSDSSRIYYTSDRANRQADALRILNDHATSLISLPSLIIGRKSTKNSRFRIVTLDSSDGGLIAGKNVLGFLKARSPYRAACDNIGDHLNAPYGDLEREHLITAVKSGLDFAAKLEPDVVVMACNTACTGSPEIYEGRQIIHLDLVQTTAEAIYKHGGKLPVLLGTLGMVESKRYPTRVAELSPHGKIQQIAQVPGGDAEACKQSKDLASLLNRRAHLPEGSEKDKEALEALIEKIISDMRNYLFECTSVWLVCTHYPLIRERLQARLNHELQQLGCFRSVKIYDAMEYQAEKLIAELDKLVQSGARTQTRHKCLIRAFTSGDVAEVEKSVRSIYGKKTVQVASWRGTKVPRPAKKAATPEAEAVVVDLTEQ